ncbi:hypothetical protein [Geitlerinema sp. PCC 9228]|nr:hypothetical protein [Geitlerinema sp. PCC 9228]
MSAKEIDRRASLHIFPATTQFFSEMEIMLAVATIQAEFAQS